MQGIAIFHNSINPDKVEKIKHMLHSWGSGMDFTKVEKMDNGYKVNGYTGNGYKGNGYKGNGYKGNGYKVIYI